LKSNIRKSFGFSCDRSVPRTEVRGLSDTSTSDNLKSNADYFSMMKKIADIMELNPSKEEIDFLKDIVKRVTKTLKREIDARKINAGVFVGGSFARETLVKDKTYDIDIFIRCKGEVDKIYSKLEPAIRKISEGIGEMEIIHGSRDYFRITVNSDNCAILRQNSLDGKLNSNIVLEVIPVKHVNSPYEINNVTDMSYSHVYYIKKKIKKNPKIRNEIIFAKAFCKAQGVYGAESYVRGFSGYAIECLIINYGSFLKMAREIANSREKIILDPEKKYKNKDEIAVSMNESKLKSPIVLVDPTWKERNVLAALSDETFIKFQSALKRFLKKPNESFFRYEEISEKKIKLEAEKKNAVLFHLKILTRGQHGDIAGTKLKKVHSFLLSRIRERFEVINHVFIYKGSDYADTYYAVKQFEKSIKRGPPISMKENVSAFKKEHRKTFVKNGVIYAIEKPMKADRKILEDIINKYKRNIIEIGAESVELLIL